MELKGTYISNQGTIDSNGYLTIKKVWVFAPSTVVTSDGISGTNLTIVDLYKHKDFPKRGTRFSDQLSGVVLQSINISKKADDEDDVLLSHRYSWIVEGTYSTAQYSYNSGVSVEKNVIYQRKEHESSKTVEKVTESTPPWKYNPLITYTPQLVLMPFKYGWDYNNAFQNVLVKNTADVRYLATCLKCNVRISIKFASLNALTLINKLTQPVVNKTPYTFWGKTYPQSTLLLYPPTYSIKTEYELADDPNMIVFGERWKYYSYEILIIYSPDGHRYFPLNVGTLAKFPNPKKSIYDVRAEQIFDITVASIPTNLSGLTPTSALTYIKRYYGNLNDATYLKLKYASYKNYIVSYLTVTLPLPLTYTGEIDLSAISGATSYLTNEFKKYKEVLFLDFNLPRY